MFTVYAHRGLSSKAPENTLAAFEAAANVTGLKWIELDVAITKDEQLVIIHDDFLDRTTDMIGEITQLNYDAIKNVSAGNWFNAKYAEEKLPTFDDVIAFANKYKMNLNIELKGVTGGNGSALSESMVKQIAEKLKALNSSSDVLLSSFNIVLLKLSQQLMPQFKRAVLFKAAAPRHSGKGNDKDSWYQDPIITGKSHPDRRREEDARKYLGGRGQNAVQHKNFHNWLCFSTFALLEDT